jgi:holo-[acyl-carrier protein] synthase
MDEMIESVGIDLVEIKRIEKILKKWGEKFTGRVFSEGEIIYCGKKAYPSIHYAARFAVKEAFLKCLGVGIGGGIALKDIEVHNNEDGRPELHLHRNAKHILKDRGITGTYLSISHTDHYATAIVVFERGFESK